MKTLILLRHAKSDWSNPQEGDHARPINARGRRAAPLMGAWMADEGYLPEKVFISTAARTRQSWARLSPLLPDPPEPVFLDEMYLADIEQLLGVIRKAGTARSIMLLGHNPGMESLLMHLSGSSRRLLMPTCAAAILETDIEDWSAAAKACAKIKAFETPKSLV